MPTSRASPADIARLAALPDVTMKGCGSFGLPPLPAKKTRSDAMNKLEARYAAHLEIRKRGGQIGDWRFQPIKLRLADRTYYTPDFLVIAVTGQVEFHETKGWWRDDARVKFKVANEQFPWFRFVGVKEGMGGWEHEWL